MVRRRKYYPPAPKEDAVQIAGADLLNKLAGSPLRPRFGWFHVGNGEYRTKIDGAKLKAMGLLPGVWDIILVGQGGIFYFIEMKRPTPTGELRKPIENKLTDDQVKFRTMLIFLGVPASHFVVVDNVMDLGRAVTKWGLANVR